MANIYQDLDPYGNTDQKGKIKEYYDDDAIKIALTMWLASKKGEYLKNSNIGGVLDNLQFKSINDNNIDAVYFRIQTGIENEFYPEIELVNLKITPDYQKRVTSIEVDFINNFSNEKQKIVVYTEDIESKLTFSYVEIDETGDNLFNFCKIKKNSINSLLIYDADLSSWKWGKYLFVNFSQADPRFSDILALING